VQRDERSAVSSSEPGSRTLVLLRHGRTAWNLIDRAQGHTDVELDEVGHEQSRRTAACLAGLRPARLWTSDLARARQTAAYLEEATGLTATADPRLREFDLGVRSGLTRSEYAERFPEQYAAWIAGEPGPLVMGEESAEQVRERVAPALVEAFQALDRGQTGIAVLHGACLKIGLFTLLGWPWASSRTLKVVDNTGWVVVTQDEDRGKPRLAAYNLTARRRSAADFVSDEGVG
jgi:glucosyl-3-phosphoglycerate phosphatase